MIGKISCYTFLLFLALLIGWSPSWAQSKGYIVQGDTAYTDGYIQFDWRKPFQVEFQRAKKSPVETYAANKLTEFGYIDSTRYAAREVVYFGEKRMVFLRELAGGALNLYEVHGEGGKQFYLNNSHLTQLTKENLQTNLQQYAATSPSWQRQLPRVRLSEHSLRYFARNINQGRKPRMSMLSFGAVASFNRSTMQLKADAYPENGFGEYSMTSENAEAGLFVEAPVWQVNNLSLMSQLSYGKMEYVSTHISSPLDQHIKLTLDFLKLSVAPRYYLNANKVSFYVEAGPELFYVKEQSSRLVEAKHKNSTTSIHEHEDVFPLQKASFSMMAGAGLQYFYLPKHYINLGLGTGQVIGKGYAINNFSTSIRINL
ncbi:outer membrane beta-barrel protein [Pontibacter amylolyticus]|uniref:outer membrane beta-barrel protein n=1 Tax=Pontibacter amylolyticus TaxID=1424080 RepID=UPI001669AD60|nr:outer membrane beta-barrel protein [Pontibacter amylolyticus]